MSGTSISLPLRFKPLKDNRGAIMVLGIFFACMMIGWMWMLVGLGDAIIWRDRSQEAADAISYSSAAIQAQGMNLISFVNILMLILACVYLVLSFVYNILDLMHVVLGSTGDNAHCMPTSSGVRKDDMQLLSKLPYLEWLEPIADYWGTAANIVERLHDGSTNGTPSTASVGGLLDKFEGVMTSVMPPLSKFEDVVAYATPWAGELTGIYTATQYKDWGKDRWGVALSGTLIPSTLTPGQSGSLFPVHKYKSCADEECEGPPINCSASDPSKCAPNTDGDKREGLPVAIPATGFTALCEYAGAKVTSAASDAVKSMLGGGVLGSIVGTLVGWVVGAVASKVSKSYCEADSSGLFGGVDDTIASILIPITALQTGGWKNKEKCPRNNWGHDGGGKCGGPDTCNRVYDIQYNNQNFWQDPVYAGGPHLVVDYAMNGNDWMQVYGAVYGGNRVEQSEKLVGVAGMQSNPGGTWNRIIPQNSDTSFSLYLSQSEFYFDCAAKWEDDACNKDSNASYNISWRARMRRMHGLSWGKDLFGYMWSGALGNTFTNVAQGKIGNIVSGMVGNTFTNKLVGSVATTAINNGFTAVKDATGNAIGGLFNQAAAVPDFIH